MDDNVDLDLVSICEEVDYHHGVLDDAHDHHLLATIASVRSMMGGGYQCIQVEQNLGIYQVTAKKS